MALLFGCISDKKYDISQCNAITLNKITTMISSVLNVNSYRNKQMSCYSGFQTFLILEWSMQKLIEFAIQNTGMQTTR